MCSSAVPDGPTGDVAAAAAAPDGQVTTAKCQADTKGGEQRNRASGQCVSWAS